MDEPLARLDEIVTPKTLFREALAGDGNAQLKLFALYRTPIRRIFDRLLSGENEMDIDSVALDFMSDKFFATAEKTDSKRSFRKFIWKPLVWAAKDYYRKKKKNRIETQLERWNDVESSNFEDPFRDLCRKEMLHAAWTQLEAFQKATPGNLYCTVLQLCDEFPEHTSQQLADVLLERSGKELSAATVRQTIRRAHIKHAQILVELSSYGLASATKSEIRSELADLNLTTFPMIDEALFPGRQGVLDATLKELDCREATEAGFYGGIVLRLIADNLGKPAEYLAEAMARKTKEPWDVQRLSAEIKKARAVFNEILLQQISSELQDNTPAAVCSRLSELGLPVDDPSLGLIAT